MDAPPRTPQPASETEEVHSAQPLFGDSSEDNLDVWTPQPASEAESSDNELPAPSVDVQLPVIPAARQEREANIPLPLDPCKCKARTWKRALLPHLPQCSRRPLPGYEYCQAHLTNSPYGRYDNPLDPSVLSKIERSQKRMQRKTTKRWYCRYFMFKQAQSTWGLDNVDDMTDEQYAQALEAVHDYLVHHPTYFHAWKLKTRPRTGRRG